MRRHISDTHTMCSEIHYISVKNGFLFFVFLSFGYYWASYLHEQHDKCGQCKIRKLKSINCTFIVNIFPSPITVFFHDLHDLLSYISNK